MHNGRRETLTQVRTRFWISKGRQIVKKVIAKCNVCKNLEGKSFGAPLSPPLPPFRLSDDFAFSKIGLDYAGPLFVKNIYEKGGKMNKAYIYIYIYIHIHIYIYIHIHIYIYHSILAPVAVQYISI